MIAEARPTTRHLWGIVLASGTDGVVQSRPQATAPHPRRTDARSARPAGPAATRSQGDMLFRHTVNRAARLVPPDQLVAVLARPHWSRARHLETIPGLQCLVQPAYRGTAPAIFLPLLKIAREDAEAIVVILPSEALVEHEARFMHYVARAAWAAGVRPDLPVVIGAPPTGPDPNHSWIEPGAPVEGLETSSIRSVRRLVARPSLSEARTLYESNGLLSTFVIVGRATTLIDLGRRFLPELLETFEPLEAAFGRAEEPLLCEAVYECMPHTSLSAGLRDGWQRFAVLPIPDVMWQDTGHADLAAAAS